MGFLDKVKESASAAASATKEAAQKGQAKVEEMQAGKQADGLLRDLGAAAYAQQTGRGTETSDSDIERIMAALQQHEAQHGPINLALTSGAAASTAPPPTAQPAASAETAAPPQAEAAAPPPPPPAAQTL